MKIDYDKTLSISQVNQNFSIATKMVDDNATIVIMKNNKPKYVIMTIEKYEELERVTEK